MDKAEIPPAVWQPNASFGVRDETAVISGAMDGAIKAAKSIPELVGLGLNLVSDPKATATQLGSFVENLDWDKATTLMLDAAKGAVYYSDFAKGGKYARHATGEAGVGMVILVVTGGASEGVQVVQQVPGILKKLAAAAIVLGTIDHFVKNADCPVCQKRTVPLTLDLCNKLVNVAKKGGVNGEPGVEKLCANIVLNDQLDEVATELLKPSYTDADVTNFLGDILRVAVPTDTNALTNRVADVRADIVQSWYKLKTSGFETKFNYLRTIQILTRTDNGYTVQVNGTTVILSQGANQNTLRACLEIGFVG